MNIDMFGASMVLVFLYEGNGGLVVRKKGCHIKSNTEKLLNKLAKPKHLFGCIGSSNVLTLGS